MKDKEYSREFLQDLEEIVYGLLDAKIDDYDENIFLPKQKPSGYEFINVEYIKSLQLSALVDGFFQTKKIFEDELKLHESGDFFIDINELRHERYVGVFGELKKLGIINSFKGKEHAQGGMMEYECFGIKKDLLAFFYLYVWALYHGHKDGKPLFGVSMNYLDTNIPPEFSI